MRFRVHNKRSQCQCGFKWRPRLLTVLLTVGLLFSIGGSLYCDFVTVTLGFVPSGYAGDEVGVALWSFLGPDRRCQTFQDAYKLGGFTTGDDNIYSKWFANGDMAWIIARCAAIVGFVFGAIALVCILINLCGDEPKLVDVLVYTAIVASVSEAAKLGLFVTTNLCISENFWYSVDLDEYMGSTSCEMSQGAFICIGSIAAYFVAGVLLIGYAVWPEIDSYKFNYDEESLQELSVEEDTLSSTKETSFLSSRQSQKWAGSQSLVECRMEPIKESEDDEIISEISEMKCNRRGISDLGSCVGSQSTNSYSDRRQSSLYSEAEEEGEKDFDALPELYRPRIPVARRVMEDDVSTITLENNF